MKGLSIPMRFYVLLSPVLGGRGICFLFAALIITGAKAQPYTENFSTAPTFIDYPGMPSWKMTAEVTLGGVVYQVTNGGNGGWAWSGAGGESGSACIKYTTASETSVTISRKDGTPFTFYGAWLSYSTTTSGYSPPYLRVTYNSSGVSSACYNASSTVTLNTSATVNSVSLAFSGLLNLSFDKMIVGPAVSGYVPLPSTTSITEFSNNSAVWGGTILDDGGGVITETGVEYNTTGTCPPFNNKIVISSGSTPFSQTIPGLSPNTTYYVRAYATNSFGTGYGNARSFTTAGAFTLVGTHSFNTAWATTGNKPTPFTKYVEGWNVTGTASNAGLVSITRLTSGTAEGAAAIRVQTPTSTEVLSTMAMKASTGASFDLESLKFRYGVRTTGGSFNTITVTGYKSGNAVNGAVATLTGLAASNSNAAWNTFTLSSNNQFNDVDEFRLTASNPSSGAQLTSFDLDVLTVAAPTISDNTPPTVSSINRQTPSSAITKLTTLIYRVTFSESVSGVDVNDLALTSTGTATGTIASVSSSSGTTIDVTVNNVSGNGTLRLDLKTTGTGIKDAANNAIAGGYTSGQAYTIDNTAPAISISSPSVSTTGAGPVTYDIVYADDNFNSATLGTGNITLNTTGTANGTIAVSGTGTSRTVTISSITGDGTIGISIAAGTASDLAGNTAPAAGPSATFTVCNTVGDYYVDNDHDGYGSGSAIQTTSCDATANGYVSAGGDCNDNNASIHPNATEVCDGLDNNCDGNTDEGLTFTTYHYDFDGDGYGRSDSTMSSCSATTPLHFAVQGGDCNDSSASIHPGATEVCDGLDNNCNGNIDEGLTFTKYYYDFDGDGYGRDDSTLISCSAAVPVGFAAQGGDCNDNSTTIHPGATEVCNGIDDNCDGNIDEGLTVVPYYYDFDGDGYGVDDSTIQSCSATVPAGFAVNGGDCSSHNASINPGAAEVCDGIDNNCDGNIDEGLTFITYYYDLDGDGYGIDDSTVVSCSATAPAGFAAQNGDCNNRDASIHPGASELGDGKDNNCDGNVDEGFPISLSCPGSTTASITVINPANPCAKAISVTSPTYAGGILTWQLTGATIGSGVDPIPASYFYNRGLTTITYFVGSGRSRASCRTTVNVLDAVKPEVLTPTADYSTPAIPGACTKSIAIVDIKVTDNCGIESILWALAGATVRSGSGQIGTQVLNVGTTNVRYTIRDVARNITTYTYNITVTDNIAPTVTMPANIVQAGCGSVAVAVPNPGISDCSALSAVSWKLTGATTATSAGRQSYVGTRNFNQGVTTITYTVKDAAGNISTGTSTVTVSCGSVARMVPVISTSIKDIKEIEVRLFPNPTTDLLALKVQSPSNEQVEVNVYNSRGQRVGSMKTFPGESIRFGDTYQAGIYLVEVTQKDKRVTVMGVKSSK